MLGSTVPSIGGLSAAIDNAKKANCDCIQIYLTNSRKWEVSEPDINLQKSILLKQNQEKIKLIAHIPFLVNIASPNENLWKKSLQRIHTEIEIAKALNVDRLILHPGNYKESCLDSGMHKIIKALNEVSEKLIEYDIYLLLETMSGRGTEIGSTFEELEFLLKNIHNSEYIGVCFDTCHVYSAGYDISKKEGMEEIMTVFDEKIGNEKIKTFHLNNTINELGSKKDYHCKLETGKIDKDSFKYLINEPSFKDIPKILEPASSEADYIAQMKFLLNLKNSESDENR